MTEAAEVLETPFEDQEIARKGGTITYRKSENIDGRYKVSLSLF